MLKILSKFMGVFFVLAAVIFYSACPKRLVGGYEIKNGKVIYNEGMKGLGTTRNFEVKGADAESFKAINRDYGRDSKNAYLRGKIIPESDGSSFEIIEVPFARDKKHVFYSNEIISDRPQDFKILFKLRSNSGNAETTYSTDGEKIYSGRKPYLPELVDVTTFEQVGKTKFLKDKNRVYYYSRVVEEADPNSFEKIGKYGEVYAKDDLSIFYNGKKVVEADVNSHKIIDKYHHKDSNNVYFSLDILSDDAENFEVLSKSYSKDSKNAYWRKKKISKDVENFEVFPSERIVGYAKDSDNAFWASQIIEGVDIQTFVGLNHNYAKDKNKVYFAVSTLNMPDILKEADAETFELVKGEKGIDAKDKNNHYNFGNIRRERRKSKN